jgi:hypothetical protein
MKTGTWSPLFTVVLAGASVLAGGVTLSIEFEIEARDRFGGETRTPSGSTEAL